MKVNALWWNESVISCSKIAENWSPILYGRFNPDFPKKLNKKFLNLTMHKTKETCVRVCNVNCINVIFKPNCHYDEGNTLIETIIYKVDRKTKRIKMSKIDIARLNWCLLFGYVMLGRVRLEKHLRISFNLRPLWKIIFLFDCYLQCMDYSCQ